MLIIIFTGAGFLWGNGSVGNFAGVLEFGAVFQEKFAVSLVFISFAYRGLNAAAYLGGEIKKPGKNIPLSLICGTLVVMVLYILLNGLYIYALPAESMKGVLEVGAKSAGALFGGKVSKVFTAAIALGLLSVLSAMIMAGPRVYYAMAKDGVFFENFGKVNRLHRTPVHAIMLQAGIAIIMTLTASFEKLLIYIGFTLSLCACAILTVIGMIKLRMTRPELKQRRRYKTWGYPWTPFFFILGNLWIIYFSIRNKPVAFLIGLGTIIIGILVYYCFKKNVPTLWPKKYFSMTKRRYTSQRKRSFHSAIILIDDETDIIKTANYFNPYNTTPLRNIRVILIRFPVALTSYEGLY